jgi:hypothetical protein
MREFHRFIDRLAPRYSPDVELPLAGPPDPGDQAYAKADHPTIDPRHVRIGVEHQITDRRI